MRRSSIFKILFVLVTSVVLASCNDKHDIDGVESCVVVDQIENAEYGLVKIKGRLWGNATHKSFYSPNIQVITIFLERNRRVSPGDTLRFNLD